MYRCKVFVRLFINTLNVRTDDDSNDNGIAVKIHPTNIPNYGMIIFLTTD